MSQLICFVGCRYKCSMAFFPTIGYSKFSDVTRRCNLTFIVKGNFHFHPSIKEAYSDYLVLLRSCRYYQEFPLTI